MKINNLENYVLEILKNDELSRRDDCYLILKVIEKLEDCVAKNKGADFHIWLKVEGCYSRFMHRCNFSVPLHFVKSILKNFYSRLESNG